MQKIINAIRSRKVSILIMLVGFFMGMVAGFLLAPVKKGVVIGCNNGATINNKSREDDFCEDLAMEMGELR